MGPVWRQARISPILAQILRGQIPATLPQTFASPTPQGGTLTTYQPGGATTTSGGGFFTSLGTNGRNCFTCHQPQAGWGMNPSTAMSIFKATHGKDPLFALVDGANCPDAGLKAEKEGDDAREGVYSQILTKANIRIFLPIPTGAQYQVNIIRDPTGCENNATYGLPTGVISMYRRVLNATNLSMNSQFDPTFTTVVPQGSIMWDGREPSLQSQFNDATLGHAQAAAAPSADSISQGVAFETSIFTAQSSDGKAGSLTANGATGGPVVLSTDVGFVPDFGAEGMNMYDAWSGSTNKAQASINRGQNIFNTTTFTVQGVGGFNDVVGNPALGTTCATCHSNQNVGSDVIPGGRHLGIGDNASADQSGNQTTATTLPPSKDQPLFSFLCTPGSIPFFSNPVVVNGVTYDDYRTSDPGMGLITGQCKDLGQFKVPRLRGLAARAPYFHGGNAATLKDVVTFYNTRFNMGLTAQQQQDLINFLGTL